MRINWNGHLLRALPAAWAQAQRAMYYGDALFETIRVFEGRIPLLNRHWERLHKGLRQLGFEIPVNWNSVFWEEHIQRIAPSNARVRLTVWRSPGGYFQPSDNRPQFLITAQALPDAVLGWPQTSLLVGVSNSVRLPVDVYSNLKTLNSARYVMAAIEARQHGWDDALVLNAFDRVCEATASNVFWWKRDVLHTVPLSEGCVAGIMRAFVQEVAMRNGCMVREEALCPEELFEADEIFLTNAIRGIQPVRIFAGAGLRTECTRWLFDHLKVRLTVLISGEAAEL